MRKSRFTTEQIIGFIKQAQAGMAVAELGRRHCFSPANFYAGRAKYGDGPQEQAVHRRHEGGPPRRRDHGPGRHRQGLRPLPTGLADRRCSPGCRPRTIERSRDCC